MCPWGEGGGGGVADLGLSPKFYHFFVASTINMTVEYDKFTFQIDAYFLKSCSSHIMVVMMTRG